MKKRDQRSLGGTAGWFRLRGAGSSVAPVMVGLALGLCSCTPTVNTRGNLIESKMMSQVIPHKTSMAEVRALLGPPTSQEMFTGKGWLYLGEQTETVSFYKPKVVTRHVYLVEFNAQGLVEKVTPYDSKGYPIEPDKEETPTHGRDPSLLAEFIGNIGRYEDPGGGIRRKKA